MRTYGKIENASGKGFVYENKASGERVVSAKPTARSLPGKLSDWRYVGRER